MTGVPAARLRAWERRYGVPNPDRTDSSYRLYSDTDVEQVRRLVDLTRRGMSPAEAARLVREAPEPEPEPPIEAPTDAFSVAVRRILDAASRLAPEELESAVREALLLGTAPHVFERVFAPALREIGDRWHRGELSVAQEHLATEILAATTRDLLRLMQPYDATRRALFGCFPDEIHTLPVFAVACRFAQWGYRTIMLGARTPPEAVEEATQRLRPAVVALSLTTVSSEERVRAALDAYSEVLGNTPWVVGGAAFTLHPALAKHAEGRGALVATGGLEALRDALAGG